MSTMTAAPVTPPIPGQLSAPEFTALLLPPLSMPQRGPKCELGYHRVFNLLCWVLYPGMPWKGLPLPTDTHGKAIIHSTTVYTVFATGAEAGALWQAVVARGRPLAAAPHTSIPACSMATGATRWPQKGRWPRGLGLQPPEGRAGHCHHRPSGLRVSPCPCSACQRDRHGLVPRGPESLAGCGQRGRAGPQRGLVSSRGRL
jgi:hypothetical protein